MSLGYLQIVLHAHLPFVRHPEYDDFLEEDWFFQAVIETYLPLLDMYERLSADGVNFKITMSLTPPLCAMMTDALLQNRFEKFLNSRIELAEKEIARTKNTPFAEIAAMYERKFKRYRTLYYDYYNKNILNGFRKFQDMDALEIVTCCATHGFLPLMLNREAVKAQIKTAVKDYRNRFLRNPPGIWLAECAYNPGDDYILREEGIRYFFLDGHGITHAKPRPRFGVFAPVYCPSAVAAFARDEESAEQVWSADTGYPGDGRYREFYRDLGYDLAYDYIKPYLHSDGVRRNVSLKYHRVTGRVELKDKEPYFPSQAEIAAREHAGNFMFNRERQLEHLHSVMGRKPVVTSMYDAELFGHWWYEGPLFLENLFRFIHASNGIIELTTPSKYLNENPINQKVQPSMSSWGDKGYNEVWLNGENDWVYRHLHIMADRMRELARRFPDAEGDLRRALNQCARELLLAQSSDWAFLMTVGTAHNYSVNRTVLHIERFNKLYEQIKHNRIDTAFLADIEGKDNIFSDINYPVFA